MIVILGAEPRSMSRVSQGLFTPIRRNRQINDRIGFLTHADTDGSGLGRALVGVADFQLHRKRTPRSASVAGLRRELQSLVSSNGRPIEPEFNI